MKRKDRANTEERSAPEINSSCNNQDIMARGNGAEEICKSDGKDRSFHGFSNAPGGPQNRTMFIGNQHSSDTLEGRRIDCEPPQLDLSKKAKRPKKPANVSASLLKIGDWQTIPQHEGHLRAKCYFGYRRIVWEILDVHYKSKIEFLWSDIASMRATFKDEEPDILEVELRHRPQFFTETVPCPGITTIWEDAYDFTNGEALTYRRHYVEFPDGNLRRYYGQLLQDEELKKLSERPYPRLSSLHFEPSERMHVGHQKYENLPSQLPHSGIRRAIDPRSANWQQSQLPHSGIRRAIDPRYANWQQSQLPQTGNPRTIDQQYEKWPSQLPHTSIQRTIDPRSANWQQSQLPQTGIQRAIDPRSANWQQSKLPQTGIQRAIDPRFANWQQSQLPQTVIQRAIDPRSANWQQSQLPQTGNPRTIDQQSANWQQSQLPQTGIQRTIDPRSANWQQSQPLQTRNPRTIDPRSANWQQSQLPQTGNPRTIDQQSANWQQSQHLQTRNPRTIDQQYENWPSQLPHTSIQRTIDPQFENWHLSQIPHTGNPRTIDQQTGNWYDPSRLPHAGIPRTIDAPPQQTGTFETVSLGVDPSMGMGMNSPCSGNSFQPFDGNSAMNPFLRQTTLPDQGIQSLNFDDRMECQAAELPFTACTTPLPNLTPQRVFPSLSTYEAGPSTYHANNWKFENHREYLMSDPDKASNNDEQLWAANEMSSIASQEWNLDSWLNDEEYNHDNGGNS